MGTIARQTSKNSFVLVLGACIGALSSIFIYPLETELYGNIQFILSSALLLAPFSDFGMRPLIIRYFPVFKTEDNRNNGFLSLIILSIFLGLLTMVFLANQGYEMFQKLLNALSWDINRFESNFYVIFGVLIGISFSSRLTLYLANYQKIVWPSIFDGFYLKIILPFIVILFSFEVVNYSMAINIYVIAISLVSFFLLIYIKRQNLLYLTFNTSFYSVSLLKEMSSYASYGLLGSLSSIIAFQIDTVMVAGFEGFSQTGIYAIAAIIGNMIIIPSKGIIPLVAAEISDHFSKNNLHKIRELYVKSSITLTITGSVLFLLIWWNINDIFSLASQTEKLKTGIQVVLFISLAKLIDVITSVNSHIILYSKHFRWNLLFVILMGVLTIASNLYFIPRMGISGAALATLISLSLFNLLKLIFVWYVFKMQPFTWATLKVLLMGGGVSMALWLLPLDFHPIINIIIRSSLVMILFGLPVYYFRLSEDISLAVEKYWEMGIAFIKR